MSEVVVTSPQELEMLISRAVCAGVQRALEKNFPKTALLPEEAAEFLGVSPHTLRGWRVQKKGPLYRKTGKGVIYLRKDLEAFLENNKKLTIDSLDHEKIA